MAVMETNLQVPPSYDVWARRYWWGLVQQYVGTEPEDISVRCDVRQGHFSAVEFDKVEFSFETVAAGVISRIAQFRSGKEGETNHQTISLTQPAPLSDIPGEFRIKDGQQPEVPMVGIRPVYDTVGNLVILHRDNRLIHT